MREFWRDYRAWLVECRDDRNWLAIVLVTTMLPVLVVAAVIVEVFDMG
jgi:hypothetical protein